MKRWSIEVEAINKEGVNVCGLQGGNIKDVQEWIVDIIVALEDGDKIVIKKKVEV